MRRAISLTELDGLPVFNADFPDDAVGIGLHFVEKLHGLDDADDLSLLHRVADLDERFGAGRRRTVERADHRAVERRAGGHGGLRGSLGGLGGRNGLRHLRRNDDRLVNRSGRGVGTIDDAHAVLAFGDFEFCHTAFANEVNQCLQFAQIHDDLPFDCGSIRAL